MVKPSRYTTWIYNFQVDDSNTIISSSGHEIVIKPEHLGLVVDEAMLQPFWSNEKIPLDMVKVYVSEMQSVGWVFRSDLVRVNDKL